MMGKPGEPRLARPCAVCQTKRVEKTKVCEECMETYKDQVNEPWFQFAIEESDRTARLLRNARRHEKPLDGIMVVGNEK